MQLEILYQDEYLVAINKPNALAVHPSKMHREDRYFALQELRNQIAQHVFPCHRLDKKTSGVLLFALNPEVNHLMQEKFANNQVRKCYHAIVRGKLSGASRIDYALKNNDGKIQEAISNYLVLKNFEIDLAFGKHSSSRYSLVEIQPETGRYHQIRKHFAHLRHPIIGDRPHGCNKQNKLWKEHFQHDTMLLHARSLEFSHPLHENTVRIEAPYSPPFLEALKILEESQI